jgi:hypothetical protein
MAWLSDREIRRAGRRLRRHRYFHGEPRVYRAIWGTTVKGSSFAGFFFAELIGME